MSRPLYPIEVMVEEIIAEAAALARLIGPTFVASPDLVRQRIARLPADVRDRAIRDSYWQLVELKVPKLLLHPNDVKALVAKPAAAQAPQPDPDDAAEQQAIQREQGAGT